MNDIGLQLRSLAAEIAEVKADRLMMGPTYDHTELEHWCCLIIVGEVGGKATATSLEAADEDTLMLHRWALMGMVADITDGAVTCTMFADGERMVNRALETWPDLTRQFEAMKAWAAAEHEGGHA